MVTTERERVEPNPTLASDSTFLSRRYNFSTKPIPAAAKEVRCPKGSIKAEDNNKFPSYGTVFPVIIWSEILRNLELHTPIAIVKSRNIIS